jgi:serine/threonine protein kinase
MSNSTAPLAAEFAALCRAGPQAPNVWAFLREHPSATRSEIVEVLLTDQRLRHESGGSARLEEYLEWQPDLRRDPDAVLDLICQEVALRECAGERPSKEEYVVRFPDLADQLSLQFHVDEVVRGVAGPDNPPTTTQGKSVDRTVDHASATGDDRLERPDSEDVDFPKVTGYEILGLLGRGGMGVVYKARHLALKRIVAIKMIPAGASTPELLSRLRTEAELIAQLQHPNIVQIFEIGELTDCPYLALEFCDGGSLEARIATNRLGFREAANLVAILSRAIDVTHANNLIHRDLKPANILFRTDGSPKITDFGLARKLDDPRLTNSGCVVGTPSYMAPEQASGRNESIGPAVDVYALGATLYACLTGRSPFAAPNVLETLWLVKTRKAIPIRSIRPDCPRALDAICLKCLEKDPAKRYASAHALAEDLGRFLDSQTDSSKATTHARRSRLLAATSAVAALGLILLAIVVARNWPRSDGTGRPTADGSSRTSSVSKSGTPIISAPPAAVQNPVDPDRSIFRRFRPPVRVFRAHFGPGPSQLLTDGSDGSVRIWDIAAGNPDNPMRTLTARPEGMRFGTFLDDGHGLLTGGEDGTIRLWNLTDGTSQLLGGDAASPTFRSVWSMAADRSGRWLISGERNSAGKLRLWDLNNKPSAAIALGKAGEVVAVAMAADGSRALTAGGDGSNNDVNYWDLSARQLIRPLKGHTKPVWSVGFSADARFAYTTATDATLRLWRLADGKEIARGSCPDGAFLLCAGLAGDSRLVSGDGNGIVRIWKLPQPWDAVDERIEIVNELRAHNTSIEDLRVDPSGDRAVSVDSNGEIIVWTLPR